MGAAGAHPQDPDKARTRRQSEKKGKSPGQTRPRRSHTNIMLSMRASKTRQKPNRREKPVHGDQAPTPTDPDRPAQARLAGAPRRAAQCMVRGSPPQQGPPARRSPPRPTPTDPAAAGWVGGGGGGVARTFDYVAVTPFRVSDKNTTNWTR